MATRVTILGLDGGVTVEAELDAAEAHVVALVGTNLTPRPAKVVLDRAGRATLARTIPAGAVSVRVALPKPMRWERAAGIIEDGHNLHLSGG